MLKVKLDRTSLFNRMLLVLARSRFSSRYVVVDAFGHELKLLKQYLNCTVDEWNVWNKYYVPEFPLQGKTVLDVGAGCGETALLYFLHGAEKVVAIEADSNAIECLRENAVRNKWNIEIINGLFNIKHLDIPHDFMKMDIEGGEKEILAHPQLVRKPCVIEVHSNELKDKFVELGFQNIYSPSASSHLLSWKGKGK